MTEYRLRIDAFTPATLPMKRLAEYMAEFARLLGEPERVHFVRVDRGSAVLVSRIDSEASTKVAKRLLEVKSGVGDPEGIKAEKRVPGRRSSLIGKLWQSRRLPVAEPSIQMMLTFAVSQSKSRSRLSCFLNCLIRRHHPS